MRITVKGDFNFPEFDFRKLFDDIGNYMVSSVIRRIKKGVPPPNSPLTVLNKKGNKTLQDTGQLINSINYQVKGNSVIIGTNRPFADVMQYGARIIPKNAEKLAIPFGWEIRRLVFEHKGIKGAIEALKKQGWKIFFTDKAIMGTKGKGKRKTTKVFFIRKDAVEIPARPFLYADEEDVRMIKSMIEEFVSDCRA
jgi:phage gpG-like protein